MMLWPWAARGTASGSQVGGDGGNEGQEHNSCHMGKPNQTDFSREAGNPHVNIKFATSVVDREFKITSQHDKTLSSSTSCLPAPDDELLPVSTFLAFNKHLLCAHGVLVIVTPSTRPSGAHGAQKLHPDLTFIVLGPPSFIPWCSGSVNLPRRGKRWARVLSGPICLNIY